jgi:hypothetical protein
MSGRRRLAVQSRAVRWRRSTPLVKLVPEEDLPRATLRYGRRLPPPLFPRVA